MPTVVKDIDVLVDKSKSNSTNSSSPSSGSTPSVKGGKESPIGGDKATVEASQVPKEGIYEFTDSKGKTYCGQSCDIPRRLKQHEKAGKLSAGESVKTTEVLGGKTAREIAEHKRIQEVTGGVPARLSDKVSNKVDPIGPARIELLE